MEENATVFGLMDCNRFKANVSEPNKVSSEQDKLALTFGCVEPKQSSDSATYDSVSRQYFGHLKSEAKDNKNEFPECIKSDDKVSVSLTAGLKPFQIMRTKKEVAKVGFKTPRKVQFSEPSDKDVIDSNPRKSQCCTIF